MTTDSWETYESFKKEIDAGMPAKNLLFDLMKEQKELIERQHLVYGRDYNVDDKFSTTMKEVMEFSYQVIKLAFELDKSVIYQIAPTPAEPVLPPAVVAQQLQESLVNGPPQSLSWCRDWMQSGSCKYGDCCLQDHPPLVSAFVQKKAVRIKHADDVGPLGKYTTGPQQKTVEISQDAQKLNVTVNNPPYTQTMPWTEFIVDRKLHYYAHTGDFDGNTIRWSNGRVYVKVQEFREATYTVIELSAARNEAKIRQVGASTFEWIRVDSPRYIDVFEPPSKGKGGGKGRGR